MTPDGGGRAPALRAEFSALVVSASDMNDSPVNPGPSRSMAEPGPDADRPHGSFSLGTDLRLEAPAWRWKSMVRKKHAPGAIWQQADAELVCLMCGSTV